MIFYVDQDGRNAIRFRFSRPIKKIVTGSELCKKISTGCCKGEYLPPEYEIVTTTIIVYK